MRGSAMPKNITIIEAYAPTVDHSDEEVEEFYEQLEQTNPEESKEIHPHGARRQECKCRS